MSPNDSVDMSSTSDGWANRENNAAANLLANFNDEFAKASKFKPPPRLSPGERIVIEIDACNELDSDTRSLQFTANGLQTGLRTPVPPPPSPNELCWGLQAPGLARSVSASNMQSPEDIARLIATSGGSLSDNSLNQTGRNLILNRGNLSVQLRDWRRANRLITKDGKHSLGLCLNYLDRMNDEQKEEEEAEDEQKDVEVQESRPSQHEGNANQEQHLQLYASHLTDFFKKNQNSIKQNDDFRALLYNIICCLLIQEDQVLASPSVSKMIEVIRSHLSSACKLYASAMISAGSVAISKVQAGNERRKSSLGSWSCTSSNSSGFNATQIGSSRLSEVILNHEQTGLTSSKPFEPEMHEDPYWNVCQMNEGSRPGSSCARSKPIDYRRISSVSYNDEQLINDLCDAECATFDGGPNANETRRDSPWSFEELSSECKHHRTLLHTSESSLDMANSSGLEFMNDSGMGTIYNCDTHSEQSSQRTRRVASYKKRSSDASEFKPMQRPSYISTDEYLSQLVEDSNPASTCADEASSSNSRCEFNKQRPVDVAGRRSELEWSLNRLINWELKFTWLTSKETLRRAIRKVGVPKEIRGKVWMILIEQIMGSDYDVSHSILLFPI